MNHRAGSKRSIMYLVYALLHLPAFIGAFILASNGLAPPWLPVVFGVGSSFVLLVIYETSQDDSNKRVPLLAWVVALCSHLVVLFHEPLLSGDVWRYLFDGALQVEALHPWSYAPASPKVADIRATIPGAINHPEVRSVYPPLAELLFSGNAWLGNSLLAWKSLILASLLGATAVLARQRTNREAFFLFGHPLCVFAVASEAHVDMVGVFALVIFAYAAKRSWTRGSAIGAAIGIKLVPVLVLPPLLTGTKRETLLGLAGCISLLALCAVPYLTAGAAPFDPLGSYLRNWSFNGSIAPLVVGVIATSIDVVASGDTFELHWLSSFYERIGHTVVFNGRAHAESWWTAKELARLIYRGLAGLMLLSAAWSARRIARPEQAIVFVFSCWLILSPVVHPWYLLWLLPFAFGHSAWHAAIRAWSVTVLLAYLVPAWQHESGQWHLPVWIPVMEYGIPLLVLVLHRRTHRKLS